LEPEKPPRTLAQLAFLPNTLASLPVPGTDHTLLAAGGQDAEIHLSLLTPESKSLWQYNTHLEGSINNSILLTSLSLTDSNESSVEPRMAVSNNDRVVMFFDVPVRTRPVTISPVGAVRFNVPVNHCESSSILLVFFCPQDPSANLHVCSWSSWKQGVKLDYKFDIQFGAPKPLHFKWFQVGTNLGLKCFPIFLAFHHLFLFLIVPGTN
jgi:hypothetical protein